ncbi:MAG: hypothetical protein E2O56_03935 [Gammaproteobacteria bacterium]|nr:MAG: hypothetical protein E2O56_03935 [Gammaproteobacteria bacterium]
MKNRFSLLFTAAALAMGSTPIGAQVQDTGAKPIQFDTPANISVEKDVTPHADRRTGRSRVHHSLNEYRLRRSGVDGMGNPRVRWVNPYSGIFAYNPADPPRWAGPAAGNRYFQTRITTQHRRLFNPH